MDNPRPEKVAVVDEVRQRLDGAGGALITEYRGLNVAAMAQLRRALRDAGGDFKVYKNTLVRFAARDLGLDLDALLTGPTAIAFVQGDPVNVAKALRDFARTNPALVVKGGMLGEKLLDADGARALAEVEPRDVLLARLAGAMAAPMQQFAGLLSALPRNLAYGLQALIEQRGGVEEPTAEIPEPDSADAATETPDEPVPAAGSEADAGPAGLTETTPAAPVATATADPTPADVADPETATADPIPADDVADPETATADPIPAEAADPDTATADPTPADDVADPETATADPTPADVADPQTATTDPAEIDTADPAETDTAPRADPTPAPSADPTPAPSADPTPAPSADPTPAPSAETDTADPAETEES